MGAVVALLVVFAILVPIILLSTRRRTGITPSALGPQPPVGTCLGCQGPLSSLGREAFRVGGTSGGWKLLFGEWAELSEDKVPLDVYACQRCRRVELRVPGAS